MHQELEQLEGHNGAAFQHGGADAAAAANQFVHVAAQQAGFNPNNAWAHIGGGAQLGGGGGGGGAFGFH